MGQQQSVSSKSSQLAPFLPYLISNSTTPCTLDHSIRFEHRDSSLPTSFPSNKSNGLYTKEAIPSGTTILEVHIDQLCMMNDGMVDLTDILSANNDDETYNSWKTLELTYYDMNKAQNMINVRMVAAPNGLFYETIKDVPAGGELLRMYGFSSWIMEFSDILSDNRLKGFARFVNEYSMDMVGDPLAPKINNMKTVLNRLIKFT